jgi:hypothetical protein
MKPLSRSPRSAWHCRRPQRPHHQHRLEEQTHEPTSVGVETETVAFVDELGQVAGKHGDEEGREQTADEDVMRTAKPAPSVEPVLADVGAGNRIAAAHQMFEVLARRVEVVGQGQFVVGVEDAKEP